MVLIILLHLTVRCIWIGRNLYPEFILRPRLEMQKQEKIKTKKEIIIINLTVLTILHFGLVFSHDSCF